VAAGAEVEVTGPVPSAADANRRWTAVGDLSIPGALRRVAMVGERGWDSRSALVGGAGTRYRFRLELPDQPALRVGLGYEPPAEGEAAGAVRHRVAVRPVAGEGGAEGAEEVVLDETVPGGTGSGWRDRQVSLERWAGEEVVLELATEVEPGSPRVAAWSAPEVVDLGGQEEGWDVLLISLDTLRADHLGCYGYHRPTSPNLDALAARGVRFATAVAQAPWTRPSHWSFLTGLYPASNGGLESPLLAEALWRAGYRTTAITGGGQINPEFGFDRGFEAYRIDDWVSAPERVVRALEEHPGRKQLLFLHTYRIHDPYDDTRFAQELPAGRIGDRFGEAEWRALDHDLTDEEKVRVEALYDGGIADTDRALGELFDGLERSGLLRRTIVAVTSDHGEQLWDHGSWRHGQNLFDHQLLVPLIVHLPPELARGLEAEGRVIEGQVQLVDLYPTLLELLGVPLEHRVQGRSLVPLLAGEALPPRDAFAENTNIKSYERKAFRSPRFKFVKSIPRSALRKRGVTEPSYQLFDLRRDPEEYHDVSARHPELVQLLEERLAALGAGLSGLQEEVPEDLTPELRKQLEALGYLGGD
jgi:arylsulfatase A-like enzyme